LIGPVQVFDDQQARALSALALDYAGDQRCRPRLRVPVFIAS
jgi:hypothetical protein